MSGVLIAAGSISAWQSGRNVHSLLMVGIQERTMQNVRLSANGAGAILDSWLGQLVMLTSGISGMPKDKYETVLKNFVAANADFVAFDLYEASTRGVMKSSIHIVSPLTSDERFLGQLPAEVAAKLSGLEATWLSTLARQNGQGSLFTANFSPQIGLPVFTLALPFRSGAGGKIWAVLTVWQTRLNAALLSGAAKAALLLDLDGNVLSASDASQIERQDVDVPTALVNAMHLTNTPFGFKLWLDSNGHRQFGAFSRIQRFNLVAITQADAEPAYRAASQIVQRSLLWSALVVLFAILLSYFSAGGITRSLRDLMATTLKIAQGDFKSRTTLKATDEVGLLGAAVNHMGDQLERLMVERVEKARLQGELQTAKIVQESFFPKERITSRDLEICAFFQPASECGGDWWGHYQLADHIHILCIADATGHGVPAALVTGMIFASASIVARRISIDEELATVPGQILSEFNRMLCDSGAGMHTTTFFVVLFDLRTGEMHYANAGHNLPLLIQSDSPGQPRTAKERRRELISSGDPLGMHGDTTFATQTAHLRAGDRLVFYTDGLIECRNAAHKQWGKRLFFRAADACESLPLSEFKSTLVAAAFQHFGEQPLDDDVTVVLVEINRQWRPVLADGDSRLRKLG